MSFIDIEPRTQEEIAETARALEREKARRAKAQRDREAAEDQLLLDRMTRGDRAFVEFGRELLELRARRRGITVIYDLSMRADDGAAVQRRRLVRVPPP